MTGIRGTYGYLIGDCGLPSGRGLVEGCEACVVVPEEDDRYKGHLRLSDRGLWSPLWKGTCRGLRGVLSSQKRMTGIRGTYGYLIGDCGLPSGRGLVEGCEACVVVPEEDDRYKGHLRLSDRGLWSPLWKGTCRGLRGVCCGPRRG